MVEEFFQQPFHISQTPSNRVYFSKTLYDTFPGQNLNQLLIMLTRAEEQSVYKEKVVPSRKDTAPSIYVAYKLKF